MSLVNATRSLSYFSVVDGGANSCNVVKFSVIWTVELSGILLQNIEPLKESEQPLNWHF